MSSIGNVRSTSVGRTESPCQAENRLGLRFHCATTNTKIEIKGGKDVTLIGCLDRNSNGDYLLTRVPTNRRQEASQYALITSEDLSKHVGERIEIRGKVVVNGNGKVSVESTTKTEVDNGTDRETKAKTEGAIGARGDRSPAVIP
jgi:hypothetical protein